MEDFLAQTVEIFYVLRLNRRANDPENCIVNL